MSGKRVWIFYESKINLGRWKMSFLHGVSVQLQYKKHQQICTQICFSVKISSGKLVGLMERCIFIWHHHYTASCIFMSLAHEERCSAAPVTHFQGIRGSGTESGSNCIILFYQERAKLCDQVLCGAFVTWLHKYSEASRHMLLCQGYSYRVR